MAGIAARAECSKVTLYGYFTSKEELFLGVIAEGIESVVDPMLSELLASAEAEPGMVLRRFGERCMTLALAPEAVAMKRLIIAQVSDPDLLKRYWEVGPQRNLRVIEDYLKAATVAGRLDIKDPTVAGHQLIALYEAETNSGGLFSDGRVFTSEYIKRVVGHAVDAFLMLYGVK
jgi:AcrR family transcriptional regulator